MDITSTLLYLMGLFMNHEYPESQQNEGVFVNNVTIVSIDINKSGIIANTSERFLSVGFSPQIMRDNFSLFEIRCPRVQTLLSGLAPMVLRLGGTTAELLTFQATSPKHYGNKISDDTMYICHPQEPMYNNYTGPEVYKNYTSSDGRTDFMMTGAEWDTVNQLALESGARVAFGLSAIKRKDGKWDPTNAEQLFDYTLRKSYVNNIDWELGNEPNAYRKNFGLVLNAEEHGKDFVKLHHILKDTEPYKDYFSESLIIGPDITKPKYMSLGYAKTFLSVAGQSVNRFSWHHYYVSSKDPNTSIKSFTDPAILDNLQHNITAIRRVVDEAGYKDTPMWIGECSSASGGGLENASDRYVAGFMWLDRLGVAAREGIELVVRWSFIHGHYSLLDQALQPLPDYWLSWIYKSLVGTEVLHVTCADYERRVRMYAHCTKASGLYPRGSVTLYGMNLYTDDVILRLSPSLEALEKHVYLLTPHGEGGLRARYVNLNSEKLQMVDNDTLPQLKPLILAPGTKVRLEGQTFGFIVIPQANVKCCML